MSGDDAMWSPAGEPRAIVVCSDATELRIDIDSTGKARYFVGSAHTTEVTEVTREVYRDVLATLAVWRMP